MAKKQIGKVTHFFDKISVAIIELTLGLKKGDKISIEGHDKVVEQTVDSMQIEHKAVEKAKKGDAIGVKTAEPVKENDKVFKVTE
ncbi:translation elongation factor-like protein [Candidatus Woesearchaeota archaeon]|nr:translation elongation factor-like protein [Candidatus Woesearchaeota archaeon]